MLSRKFQLLEIQSWCPSAPNKWRNGPNGSVPDDTVHFLISLSRLLFLLPLSSAASPFFFLLPFSCYFSLRSLSCVSFSLSWWGFCPQSRLARLVVGPFWGWNCTGGRPSVHCNATHHTLLHSTFQKYPGSPFVGWLIGAVLTLMRLCSGRLQAAMWSCRSCWEKFWCIWAASWASMLFPQALFRSEGRRSLWQLDPPSTSDFVLVQPHRYFC